MGEFDKQIIIDGVDVSGCSFYEDNPKYRMWGTCDCMRTMIDQSGYDELAGAECKGYNCYYKQFKRSEAQCEAMFVYHTDLEKKYKAKEQECESYKMEAEEGKEINAELKAENDELKKQHQGDKGLITSTGKMNYQLIQEYNKLKAELEQEKALKETYLACYKAKHEDIEGELFKLSKTLTEIKTDILDIREGISYFWVIDKCDEILQKISECEGNND